MFKYKRGVIILLITIIININNSIYANNTSQLEVTGTAAILMEKSTGRVIFDYNADLKIYPASMIKVLTALVTLDYIDPYEVIVVGTEINNVSLAYSRAGHVVGEHITGLNLIRGLLIPSGNDTANIVVMNVARRVTNNNNISYEEAEKIFTDLMNQKARELGAYNSNFTNAHGSHNPDLYTTVRDLAIIGKRAMENEIIKMIASEAVFTGNSAGNQVKPNIRTTDFNWFNTNRLLAGQHFNADVTGLKTGFTDQAGHSLIGTAEREGIELISVVSGSVNPDRWTDTTALFRYGFNNYTIELLQSTSEPLDEIKIHNHRWGEAESVEVFSLEEFTFFLNEEEKKLLTVDIIYDIEKVVIIEDEEENESIFLLAPIKQGERIGEVIHRLDGDIIYTGDIILNEDVNARTLLSSVLFVASFLRDNAFSIFGLSFLLLCIFFGVIIHKIFITIRKIIKRRSRKYHI